MLLDLMMETVDAGSKVSAQLKEAGIKAPIFLPSSVGDAVRNNIDARELGLAGIFQKPIDHKVLLATLKPGRHLMAVRASQTRHIPRGSSRPGITTTG